MIKKVNGFTLIELITIIIIVGILAAYPLLTWQGNVINLDAEAEKLASNIRYAQSLSMTKGARYQFIKTSATSYQITSSSGTPVMLGQGSTTVTLNAGVTFGTFVNVPNNLIAFDGEGAPYTDNAATPTALSANANIPITANGNTETIVIAPETGSITIQ